MSTIIYYLPQKYLNGNKSEMAFWHVAYYLLAQGRMVSAQTGQAVETNVAQLLQLSGISERQLSKERNRMYLSQEPAYRIVEEDTVGGVVWRSMGYPTAVSKHVIQVPQTMVRNGWLVLLHNARSRFALAVVNQLLRQPLGRRTLSLDVLRQHCHHPDRKTPPSRADIETAVQFLQAYGLVMVSHKPDGDKLCTLEMARFEQTASTDEVTEAGVGEDTAVVEPSTKAMIEKARQRDALRTERALLCADVGEFALATHFQEIWRDLAYVDWALEQGILLKKLRRTEYRHAPPAAERWQDFWQAYCVSRERRTKNLFSTKVTVWLTAVGEETMTLTIKKLNRSRLRFAKLLLWLDDPNFAMRFGGEARVAVYPGTDSTGSSGEEAWRVLPLTAEKEVIRLDVTPLLKNGLGAVTLVVTVVDSIPSVSIACQLEARSFK